MGSHEFTIVITIQIVNNCKNVVKISCGLVVVSLLDYMGNN
jgi:hypothetical protein